MDFRTGPKKIQTNEKPPWALAVAEVAPTGVDRQGRGRSLTPGLPPR